jgi:hypothetical protein
VDETAFDLILQDSEEESEDYVFLHSLLEDVENIEEVIQLCTDALDGRVVHSNEPAIQWI